MIVPGHDPIWDTIFVDCEIPEGARQPASVDVRLGEFLIWNSIRFSLKQYGHAGYLLAPGKFVLGETVEAISTPATHCARLEGKSTLGRRGLIIHATAGFIDPGFCGRLTLEMSNLSDTAIYLTEGMWIGQLSLHQMSTPVKQSHLYSGKYQYATGVESAKD